MRIHLATKSLRTALGVVALVVAAGCNNGGGDDPVPVSGVPLPGRPSAASSTLNVTIRNSSGRTAWVKFVGDSMQVSAAEDSIPAGESRVFGVDGIVAGRIYISYDRLHGTKPDGANSGDPDYNTRFDKVELTYQYDRSTDHASGKMNLTAVDHFAIPLELDTWIGNVRIEHLSLAEGQTATTLMAALKDVAGPAAVVPPTGPTIRVLSPQKKPEAYKGFDVLLNRLDDTQFTITGQYFGKKSVRYNFKGAMDGDTIRLEDGGDKLTISKSSLMWSGTDATNFNGIYTCNGAYKFNGLPKQVSDNDVPAAVYRDLVTGFNLGFVGIGANDSAGWWSQTAFRTAPFNEYAKVVAERYSGAYGFPFNDRYEHVLADLGRGESGGTWGGIDGVTINILDDNTSSTPYHYTGNEDPQDGVTTYNISINAGSSNESVFPATEFRFNAQKYFGGKSYQWPAKEGADGTHSGYTVDISSIPAKEGLNLYHLEFGWKKFLVLVNVSGGQWQWGAIAGGGNSTWQIMSGTPVLFVGGVLD
ncbi:MAG: beta-1,3-glucanase family protein [Burkholderiales bacterium]